MDTMEINAPDIDCDIDGGSDGPAATGKDIPSGPIPTLPTEHENINYELPPLLSYRLITGSGHNFPFHFGIH